MRSRKYRKVAAAAVGGVAMVSSAMAFGADWDGSYGRHEDGDDHGSLQEKIELLRKKVKYVFVIFHENESFDHYLWDLPGRKWSFRGAQGLHACQPDRRVSPSAISIRLSTSKPSRRS